MNDVHIIYAIDAVCFLALIMGTYGVAFYYDWQDSKRRGAEHYGRWPPS